MTVQDSSESRPRSGNNPSSLIAIEPAAQGMGATMTSGQTLTAKGALTPRVSPKPKAQVAHSGAWRAREECNGVQCVRVKTQGQL